jgi:hypothetical protein
MTLSQKIAAALDSHSGPWTAPGPVAVETETHRLSLTLDAVGSVGLAFESLSFATLARTDWTDEALRSWGDQLAARVNYLMEPLVVLEHDRVSGEIAIRSQAPTPRHTQRSYYEARLERQGILQLSRVAFDSETRRRSVIPCQMTREVLERLADDLVETSGC